VKLGRVRGLDALKEGDRIVAAGTQRSGVLEAEAVLVTGTVLE